MKKYILFALALALCVPFLNAVDLVKNHKPVGRIVLADTTAVSRSAAELLQKWVKRITDAELPVVQLSLIHISSTADIQENGAP